MVICDNKCKHGFGDEFYLADTPYESLIWEEVIPYKGTQLRHRTWRYDKDTTTCMSCENSSNMFYLIESSGVIGRCAACGCTFPVNPVELDPTGNSIIRTLAQLLDDKIVTTVQAAAICERIGQVLPIVASPDRQTYVKTKKPIPKTLADIAKSSESFVK